MDETAIPPDKESTRAARRGTLGDQDCIIRRIVWYDLLKSVTMCTICQFLLLFAAMFHYPLFVCKHLLAFATND